MAEQVRVVSPFNDPRYDPTPEQAAYELARRAASGEVSPGSVSRTELAADVQTSLAKADAALPATTASATYAPIGGVPAAQVRPMASHPDVLVRQTAASNSLSDGVSTGLTTQMYHIASVASRELRLIYRNVYNNNGAITDGPNAISVKAGVRQAGGLLWPVYFNGARTASIDPGGVLVSDPVPIALAKGAAFYTRTFVSVAGGAKYPLGRLTDSTQEGYNTTDTVDTTITSGSVRGYGPNAILGTPTVALGSSPLVAVAGDSIAAGYQDTWGAGSTDANGWVARTFDGVLSYTNISVSGNSASNLQTMNAAARQLRMLGPGRPDVIFAPLGINDLQASATESQLRTRLTNMWLALAATGAAQWAATITPQTTSTDSWATTGNQTVTSVHTARLAVNAWLRDGAPILSGAPAATGSNAAGTLRIGQAGHPVAKLLEVSDAVESARDSGLWKATYTSDGTHPNATGAASIAAAITPSTLAIVLP